MVKTPLLSFPKNVRLPARTYARYVVEREDLESRFPRSQPVTHKDDFYANQNAKRQNPESSLAFVKDGVVEESSAPSRSLDDIESAWKKGLSKGLHSSEFDLGKPVQEFFGEEHVDSLVDWNFEPTALKGEEEDPSVGDMTFSFLEEVEFTPVQMKVMESLLKECDNFDVVKGLGKDDLPDIHYKKLKELTTPEEYATVENYLLFVLEDINHEFNLPAIADVIESHWDNVRNNAVRYLDESLEQHLSILNYTSFQSQQYMVDADGIRVDQRGSYAWMEKYYPEAVDRALVEAEIGVLNYKYRPELRYHRLTPTEAIESLHSHTIGVETAEKEIDLNNRVTMQADSDVGGKKVMELMLSVKRMGDITGKLISEVNGLKNKIETLTYGAEEEEEEDDSASEFRVDLKDRKFILTEEEFWDQWSDYGVTKELRDQWVDPKFRWQFQKDTIVKRKANPKQNYDRGIDYVEHREYRFLHMMRAPVEEQQELLEEFGVFKHFSK